MTQRFFREDKLLKASDFNNLRTGAEYVSTKFVYAFYKPNSLSRGRLGITSSRKTGKAIFRNSLKRRVREAFRLSSLRSVGVDVVVITRNSLKTKIDRDFEEFNKDVELLINKICRKAT